MKTIITAITLLAIATSALAATTTADMTGDPHLVRATAYEAKYAEPGPTLPAYRCTLEVKTRNWAGLPGKSVAGVAAITNVASTIDAGWTLFRQVGAMTDPAGWEVECTATDRELAGFKHLTITADRNDITSIEYSDNGWF